MYRIIIEKTEENPNFEQEKQDMKEQRQFGYSRNETSPFPNREVTKNLLQVVLTEEEYKAIKKAVLETFN